MQIALVSLDTVTGAVRRYTCAGGGASPELAGTAQFDTWQKSRHDEGYCYQLIQNFRRGYASDDEMPDPPSPAPVAAGWASA